MQVYWNRTSKYNEVSCNTAHCAAIMLCSGRKLLRTELAGSRTIYYFHYETFQRFPRYEADFAALKSNITLKDYFDTYRQLLDGRAGTLLELNTVVA